MAHAVAVARPDLGRIAMNARGVPQIKLHAQIWPRQIIDNPSRLIEIIQEISGHVVGVDRLDGQAQIGGLIGGPSQIFDIGLFVLRAFGDTGHHMHPLRPKRSPAAQLPGGVLISAKGSPFNAASHSAAVCS